VTPLGAFLLKPLPITTPHAKFSYFEHPTSLITLKSISRVREKSILISQEDFKKKFSRGIRTFCFLTEDMNIRKEITVTYEELQPLGEEFVQDLQRNQRVRISSVILPFLCRMKFLHL